MKYAIQASYYMWDNTTEEEYEQWLYLAVDEHKIFVFEDNVTERTKLFENAKQAGEYVDKHFGKDKMRCSFSTVRIVEIKED